MENGCICVAPWKGKIKLMDSFEDAWKVISDYCNTKITDIATIHGSAEFSPLTLTLTTEPLICLYQMTFTPKH